MSTRAATRAVAAAEVQTKIQQQLRVDAAQPYAWVDVRPDDTAATLFNLVVGNSGPTVATNVRIKVDPSLPAIDQLKERAEVAQARLASGIQSLAPNRLLTWPLGQGFTLLDREDPQAYTFTVTADGPFGPVPPLTYVGDMSDWQGMLHRPAGSLHQLTAAVNDLTKKINNQSRRPTRVM
jgi:hypothetical protein